MRHCWSKGYKIGLYELMPFLPDGYALFTDSHDAAPDLLPIKSTQVLFGDGKQAWIRIEIDRPVLRQRNLSPEKLLDNARIFGSQYRLVTSDRPTASYESLTEFSYRRKRSEVLAALCSEYDRSLLACDRSFPGSRRFVVLSKRDKLLSHEAVTFAAMHHLSNVVRYRPSDAERLLRTKEAWLLTSWVDRACESFLLNIATRVTGEEHLIA